VSEDSKRFLVIYIPTDMLHLRQVYCTQHWRRATPTNN